MSSCSACTLTTLPTERHRRTVSFSQGRDRDVCGRIWAIMRGWNGRVIRGGTFPHLCAWAPTVGPLWGRGPRPFSPFLAPSSVQHCLGHPPAPTRATCEWSHRGRHVSHTCLSSCTSYVSPFAHTACVCMSPHTERIGSAVSHTFAALHQCFTVIVHCLTPRCYCHARFTVATVLARSLATVAHHRQHKPGCTLLW